MNTYDDRNEIPENGELDGMRRDAQADADSDALIAQAEFEDRNHLQHLAYGIYKGQHCQFKCTIRGTTTTQLGLAIAYADDYFLMNFEHPISHRRSTRLIYKNDVKGMLTPDCQIWIEGPNDLETLTQRGGKRAGAGRPRTHQQERKPRTARVSDFELEEILDHYESFQAFVDHAIHTL